MSTLNSPEYYRRRLLQSQERAAHAITPEARAIHHEFAERYAELLQAAEHVPARPAPRLAVPAR